MKSLSILILTAMISTQAPAQASEDGNPAKKLVSCTGLTGDTRMRVDLFQFENDRLSGYYSQVILIPPEIFTDEEIIKQLPADELERLRERPEMEFVRGSLKISENGSARAFEMFVADTDDIPFAKFELPKVGSKTIDIHAINMGNRKWGTFDCESF